METYAKLFADSARGIYIPQYFAESIEPKDWRGIDAEDLAILKSGPYHEFYWEAWESVLDHAEHKDGWTLYQDGDLWVINRDSAIDALNEAISDRLEYEESHCDAGDAYSHIIPDSLAYDATKEDSFPALTDAMGKEYMVKDESESFGYRWEKKYPIDTKGLDSDTLADMALDCFEMHPGSIYGPYDDSDSFPIASFPVQEIEIDLEGIVEGIAFDLVNQSLDAYVREGSTLGYVSTDSVWFAMVPVKGFQDLIDAKHAETMESLASFYREYSSGDPWGDCLGFHFRLCEYLHFFRESDIPDHWQFRPGVGHDIEPDYMDVFGDCSNYALIQFGNKLNRLADILRAKNLDY